eukprot:SAG31_NODE_42293_length_272_cov_0.745665_1_plen_86_part_01
MLPNSHSGAYGNLGSRIDWYQRRECRAAKWHRPRLVVASARHCNRRQTVLPSDDQVRPASKTIFAAQFLEAIVLHAWRERPAIAVL